MITRKKPTSRTGWNNCGHSTRRRWRLRRKYSSKKRLSSCHWENNVTIIGRMDQVNSLGRKDVEIIDYKTGKPKKEVEAKKDLQLSLYALAAKEIFEWNPVRLVFHYLQNNQIQATMRDAKQLDEAQRIVQQAAADIRARQFPAKPGFICRSCAYKPICPAHEEALSVKPN